MIADLLKLVQEGDREASADLLPIVYEKLRQIAESKLRAERPGHTLQATALVHEAYLRLVGSTHSEDLWDGEGHFFAAAAEAMKRVLVDYARRKNSLKRGGDRARQPIDQLEDALAALEVPEHILELNSALEMLKLRDPTAAELVHLRYFTGLTNAQAAAAIGISTRTADRLWQYSRAWLFTEIQSEIHRENKNL